jgi:EF hand
MKRIITILSVVALGLLFTVPAHAAKPGKKGKRGGGALAMYDKDGNGKIDGTEIETLKADFTAGKAEAKALDTDNSGSLSDDEITAAGAKKKGKKKKAQ